MPPEDLLTKYAQLAAIEEALQELWELTRDDQQRIAVLAARDALASQIENDPSNSIEAMREAIEHPTVSPLPYTVYGGSTRTLRTSCKTPKPPPKAQERSLWDHLNDPGEDND